MVVLDVYKYVVMDIDVKIQSQNFLEIFKVCKNIESICNVKNT